MKDQAERLAQAHTHDRMPTVRRARPAGYVQPLVRARSRPTAHPAAEAWRAEPFARLQERLAVAMAGRRGVSPRSMIVLPSRSVDRWHEPPAETRSYEERLLSFLFELRDPALELTYVTSLPVAQRTIDYYIALLPQKLRMSARKRLRLIALGDGGPRPLSEKLLGRREVLEQIRRTVADPTLAYLMPHNPTALEREIALALDIPTFGADPEHAWLGTKSGSRWLFARAGVPHPLGSGQIKTIPEVVDAICALRAAKPELAEVVIKLDHAVSGEGNAVLGLVGLPASGAGAESVLIQQRLEQLVPEVAGVSAAAFLRKLATQGGVVEERVTCREVRSPSVQLEIAPAGAVTVLSTHDQILRGRSGQQFAGCRFPADQAYAALISKHALRVAERLADMGVIGPLGIDFLVTRGERGEWQAFALEVNLRMGGTTHPYRTLARLTDGSYDSAAARFTTRGGQPRHYVATDHLEIPQLRDLGRAGLLARATREGIRFDHDRGRGVIFHMLSSVEPLATVGVTAIADTAGGANDLFAHVRVAIAHLGCKQDLRGHTSADRQCLQGSNRDEIALATRRGPSPSDRGQFPAI
jgi:hypothetical protein